MTYICVGKLTIIGSDNGLSPGRRQAIIWTNAGILLIGPVGTNFSEMLIGIQTFSLKKIRLKCRLRNVVHFVSASMCYMYEHSLLTPTDHGAHHVSSVARVAKAWNLISQHAILSGRLSDGLNAFERSVIMFDNISYLISVELFRIHQGVLNVLQFWQHE